MSKAFPITAEGENRLLLAIALAGNPMMYLPGTPGAGQPEAKLATPEEVAMALHHAKQRQIQGQQFPDTLVDATNGQPLHVPGVPGSAHNGVSGVGGIFGVGGLLGPDEPIAMRESEALTLGPSCTCAKCVGSPPVCSGCTCRRR